MSATRVKLRSSVNRVRERLSRGGIRSLSYRELHNTLLAKDTLGLTEKQVSAIRRRIKRYEQNMRRRLSEGIDHLSGAELLNVLVARHSLGLSHTQVRDIRQRSRVLNSIRAGRDQELARLRKLLLEGIVHMEFDDLYDAWYFRKKLSLNPDWVIAIKRELKRKSYTVPEADRIAVLLDMGVDYLDPHDLKAALEDPEGFELTNEEISQIKRRLEVKPVLCAR